MKRISLFYGSLAKFLKNLFGSEDFKKRLAFNMLEITISVIVISCIAAAFVPTITKKVIRSSIAIREAAEAITDCSGVKPPGCPSGLDIDCKLCFPGKCTVCNKTCRSDQAKIHRCCACEDCSNRDQACIKCTDKEQGGKNCDKCRAGYYLKQPEYKCEPCPEGHACPEGTQCPAPCKEWQWSNKKMSVCNLPCGFGAPGNMVGGAYCHTIAQNFVNDCKREHIREDCFRGHYCQLGDRMRVCPEGRYQEKTRKAGCDCCPAETWNDVPPDEFDTKDMNHASVDSCKDYKCGDIFVCINCTRTDCSKASEDKYGNEHRMYANKDSHICIECERGHCCKYGYRNICNKGTYSPEDNGLECVAKWIKERDGKYADCTSCPVGKYQDKVKQDHCKNCAPGWWTCKPNGKDHITTNETEYPGCFKRTDGKIGTLVGNNWQDVSTNGCGWKCEKGWYCPGDGTKRKCTKGHYCPEKSSSETDCPCGHYCPNDGMDSPIKCPVGYFQNLTGQTSCNPAPCGHYQDLTGQCSYNACPAGKYQNKSGQTGCETTPCGHYTASAGHCEPVACPAGNYQNEKGQTSCKGIPCGHFQDLTGQCSYKACPVCKWQDEENQVACKPAGAGHYQNESGKCYRNVCPIGYKCPGECEPVPICCPTGHYQPNTTQSSCIACPRGQYQPSTCQNGCICVPCGNYQNYPGKDSYIACSPGQYQDENCQRSCKPVPGGYYQNLSGKCDYIICPAGKYCPGGPTKGTENPITCPSGKYCPEGTETPKDCPCGHYCGVGSSVPSECPAGTYSNANAGSCTSCPSGKYCPSAKTCTPTGCPCGHYCGVGSSVPSACLAGTYSNASAGSCTSCPSGKYCPSAGTCTPVNCPPNTYSTGGASVCPCCPAGQYAPYSGTTSCSTCPAGKYCASCSVHDCPCGHYCGAGSGVPSECGAGTYSSSGASSCSSCPAGKYCQNTKTCTPVDCPAGKYSYAGWSDCAACQCGYYCTGGSNTPTQYGCSAGTYSEWGWNGCAGCPAGYTSSNYACGCPDCAPGYYRHSNGTCVYDWCTAKGAGKFIRIGDLCVMKYNVGTAEIGYSRDANSPTDKVQWVQANTTAQCGSYACCWTGNTAPSCTGTGCNRPVCNYAGAVYQCRNATYLDRPANTWRLPTLQEAKVIFFDYRNQLNLCSGRGTVKCHGLDVPACPGLYDNACHPRYIWTSDHGGEADPDYPSATKMLSFTLEDDNNYTPVAARRKHPNSVRCVANML